MKIKWTKIIFHFFGLYNLHLVKDILGIIICDIANDQARKVLFSPSLEFNFTIVYKCVFYTFLNIENWRFYNSWIETLSSFTSSHLHEIKHNQMCWPIVLDAIWWVAPTKTITQIWVDQGEKYKYCFYSMDHYTNLYFKHIIHIYSFFFYCHLFY